MIHGILLINKPSGISSHDVVENVRKLFRMKKVGHFGTLDPLAQGLLIIGMGNATKFFDFYLKKRKVYSGLITFGYATTTYDSEGEPISEKQFIDLNSVDIPDLLKTFTGKLMQTPPLYSAKKYKGKPMYQYARENKENLVEIKPSQVEIYSLEAKIIDCNTLWFRAETSSGTYIRSLAHDMGQKLLIGAFLKELIREGVGEFLLDKAYTLDQVAKAAESGDISRVVFPIEGLLPEFPKIIVSPGARFSVLNGKAVLPGDVLKIITGDDNNFFRIFDDEGKLLAIANKDPKLVRFNPFIVFNN